LLKLSHRRILHEDESMSTNEYSSLVARHRNYFRTGATRGVEWRKSQLTALRIMMAERAEDFYASLWTDLRRGRVEADIVDVKYLVGEAEHALAHVGQWMEPMRVSSPRVRFDPLGVGLIIGTWNYPVMLTLSPLIAAICGGNVAVIKPSEVAAATANVIARLIPEYLDRSAFSVVLGAAPETTPKTYKWPPDTELSRRMREWRRRRQYEGAPKFGCPG
jgi:aldehyde dehydrogenase (NAD+)